LITELVSIDHQKGKYSIIGILTLIQMLSKAELMHNQ